MANVKRTLVAGASGYLGRHVTRTLLDRGVATKALVRNRDRLSMDDENLETVEAEVTRADSLSGLLSDVDYVISTVGITRQKDGLTYMDVDYQANANLLAEARRAKIKKFVYVSVLNGQRLRKLKICEAKERFCDELMASGMDYTIIRPNGFFSDMADFLKMAKRGRVYLFGDGTLKMNPIHGRDIAKVTVDALSASVREVNAGGPDLLTQNQIAEMALRVYGKTGRVTHLPDWVRRFAIWSLRTFTGSKTYGPIEFFLTTMATDMSAPQYGEYRLDTFFNQHAE